MCVDHTDNFDIICRNINFLESNIIATAILYVEAAICYYVLVVVVVVLLFYVHGKHLRSCRDGQLT